MTMTILFVFTEQTSLHERHLYTASSWCQKTGRIHTVHAYDKNNQFSSPALVGRLPAFAGDSPAFAGAYPH
jgi:hypothetical protein